MRRKGHPSRPRAITCCRFSSLKTLLMPTKATVPTSESTSQAPFSLAGFQVTIIGRFWVTAEGIEAFDESIADNELYREYADAVLRSFPFQELLARIRELLAGVGLVRLFVFFDDFS